MGTNDCLDFIGGNTVNVNDVRIQASIAMLPMVLSCVRDANHRDELSDVTRSCIRKVGMARFCADVAVSYADALVERLNCG